MADVVEEADLPWGADEFLDAVDAYPRDQFDFLEGVPDDQSLEGYLFPATYQVNTDWSPEDLVFSMLAKFDEVFTPQLEERAEDMGLSIHEVITLASIVEREAAVDSGASHDRSGLPQSDQYSRRNERPASGGPDGAVCPWGRRRLVAGAGWR